MEASTQEILYCIFNGKTLTEAINERAGDWDIESDELASSNERAALDYEREVIEFKNDVKVKFNTFLSGVQALEDAFALCNKYGVKYYAAPDCPFKNLAGLSPDCNKWLNAIVKQVVEV